MDTATVVESFGIDDTTAPGAAEEIGAVTDEGGRAAKGDDNPAAAERGPSLLPPKLLRRPDANGLTMEEEDDAAAT